MIETFACNVKNEDLDSQMVTENQTIGSNQPSISQEK